LEAKEVDLEAERLLVAMQLSFPSRVRWLFLERFFGVFGKDFYWGLKSGE